MKLISSYILIFFTFVVNSTALAQQENILVNINWDPVKSYESFKGNGPHFQPVKGRWDTDNQIPYSVQYFNIHGDDASFQLQKIETAELSIAEINCLTLTDYPTEFNFKTKVVSSRKNFKTIIEVNALRLNNQTGKVEKLIEYSGILNTTMTLNVQTKNYVASSVLSVGNGVGHNIEAVLDKNTTKAIILNDFYESDLDTYKSGKITYPFESIEAGNHTLSLKVWDVYNNSQNEEIEFIVALNEELALDHVLNYPNPFTTRTEFSFEHNQVCDYLDVQIQVFTVSGKLVKTINKRAHSDGYRIDGIIWNGTDDYGDNIGKGVYVYKVKVVSEKGDKVEKFEKLVVLK